MVSRHEKSVLDDESVKVGELLDGGLVGELKVLLLEFSGDGILVAEDKVNLEGKESRELFA